MKDNLTLLFFSTMLIVTFLLISEHNEAKQNWTTIQVLEEEIAKRDSVNTRNIARQDSTEEANESYAEGFMKLKNNKK